MNVTVQTLYVLREDVQSRRGSVLLVLTSPAEVNLSHVLETPGDLLLCDSDASGVHAPDLELSGFFESGLPN